MRASADLAEPAALVVEHRLPDFPGGVHHEWPITRDRLIERNAADEQQLGVATRETAPNEAVRRQHLCLSAGFAGTFF